MSHKGKFIEAATLRGMIFRRKKLQNTCSSSGFPVKRWNRFLWSSPSAPRPEVPDQVSQRLGPGEAAPTPLLRNVP